MTRSTRMQHMGFNLPIPPEHPRRALTLAWYALVFFLASAGFILLAFALIERM